MKSYEVIVQEARCLVSNIEQSKAKIAKMAIEVCEIRHGGRSNGFYTVKDFAEDIGVNAKSLQNWIYVFRDVLTKIGIQEPTKKEWSDATKTNGLLKTQRHVDNKKSGTEMTRRAYKQEVSPQSVREIFEDIQDGNSSLMKFERIYSSTQYNKTMLGDISLEVVDYEKLVRVMEWLDESSDLINDYLTERRNRKAS